MQWADWRALCVGLPWLVVERAALRWVAVVQVPWFDTGRRAADWGFLCKKCVGPDLRGIKVWYSQASFGKHWRSARLGRTGVRRRLAIRPRLFRAARGGGSSTGPAISLFLMGFA